MAWRGVSHVPALISRWWRETKKNRRWQCSHYRTWQGLLLQSLCIPAIHGGQMHESGHSGEAAREMASWGRNSGFSLDASVRIETKDRAGLERLLRYCARPVFASQRLSWAREGEKLLYQLPKPRADGQSVLELTPVELLERLAALIPPPRRHRHR